MKQISTFVFRILLLFAFTQIAKMPLYAQGPPAWWVNADISITGPRNGTLASPFLSIGQAVAAANASGFTGLKTIYVAPGTYTGANNINMRISVSNLRIVGEPGGKTDAVADRGPASNAPVIDGNFATAYGFLLNGAIDTVTIEGFVIKNLRGGPTVGGNVGISPTTGVGILMNNFNSAPIANSAVNYGVANFFTTTSETDPNVAISFNDNKFENIDFAGIFISSTRQSHNFCSVNNNIVNLNDFVGNAGEPGGLSNYLSDGERCNNTEQRYQYTANDRYVFGIYLCNLYRGTISNNYIQGGDVGLSLRVFAPYAGSPIFVDSNLISRNEIRYNRSYNMRIVGDCFGNAGATSNLARVRYTQIFNNTFRNRNELNSNNGGRGRVLALDNKSSSAKIEAHILRYNDIFYEITNPGGTSNRALFIDDIEGDNFFEFNNYKAEFIPQSLILNTVACATQTEGGPGVCTEGCTEYHYNAMHFRYNNGNNQANWYIKQNNFNGHYTNAPRDAGATFYFENLTQNTFIKIIRIEENYISNFHSIVRGSCELEANELSSVNLFNNHITSFKWASILEDPGQGIVDMSGNWWGTNNPTILSAIDFDRLTTDYTPWLDVGTDMEPNTPGFQGNFNYLHVDRASPQSPAAWAAAQPVTAGSFGRVGEAIGMVNPGGTLLIYDRLISPMPPTSNQFAPYNEGDYNIVDKPVYFTSTQDGNPMIDFLRMDIPDTTQKLILQRPFRISRLLDLQSGLIELNGHDLRITCNTPPVIPHGYLSGGSNQSYVITNSTGRLFRDCLGPTSGPNTATPVACVAAGAGDGSTFKFAVGTATTYAPLVMQNLGAFDNFGVRVIDEVYEPPTIFGTPFKNVVRQTWFLSEANPNNNLCGSNNNVNLSLQWNSDRESTAFNREFSRVRGFVSGGTPTGWVNVPGTGGQALGALVSGIGPYQRSAPGLTMEFNEKALSVFSDCPERPTAQNVGRCEPGMLTITVIPGSPAGDFARLYTVAKGGTPIASDNMAPFELTTPMVNGTQDFWVAMAFNNTLSETGCESQRVKITVTATGNPADPTALPVQRCGPGMVTITASMGNPAGTEIRFYTSALQSSQIATDNSAPYTYMTPTVTTTTTYYVASFIVPGNCASNFVPVVVTIDPIPASPTAMGVSRCGSGVVTFMANPGAVQNPEVRLYTMMNGGSPISSTMLFPYLLTTGSITMTTTYWVAQTLDGICESARTSAVATVHQENLATPQADNVTRCGPGMLTFTARGITTSAVVLYDQPMGGNIVTTAGSPFQVMTSAALTTNYYLAQRNPSTGCESGRLLITGTVTPGPGVPSAANVTRCGPGLVTFTGMMGTPSGSELRLYTQAVGGVQVAVSTMSPYLLSPPPVSQSTTYYVESNLPASGCNSGRVMVVATVNGATILPSVLSVNRCGVGVATFTVTSAGPGDIVRLYTSPTAMMASGETSVPPYAVMSPSISITSTFYISTTNSTVNCESDRVPVIATVNRLLSNAGGEDVTRCGAGPVTFTATIPGGDGNAIWLYTQASGGSPIATALSAPYLLTSVINTNSTFFIENVNTTTGCVSAERIAVMGRVNGAPAQPNVPMVTRCDGGVVTFTVQNTQAGLSFRLYNNITGGSPLTAANSNPFVLTTQVATTSTFYVSALDVAANCEGMRTPVVAMVLPAPGPPIVSDQQRCGEGFVTFSAQMTSPMGSEVRYYTVPMGGVPVFASSASPFTFVTRSLTTTTSYYVETFSALNSCASTTRTLAQGIIFALPGAPTVAAISRCDGGVVTFTALPGVPAGSEMRLYASMMGGSPLVVSSAAPFTLTTPFTALSTTYYISSFSAQQGCEGVRSAAVVNILPLPGVPSAQPVYRCQTGSVVLTAQMGVPMGTRLELYTQMQGGNAIANDPTDPYLFQTPVVTTTTTFYVGSNNATAGCNSLRVPVVVTINEILPGAPIVSNVSRCGRGGVTFTAQMGTPIGTELRLYNTPVGGNAIAMGSGTTALLSTPALASTATYYVTTYNELTGCESPRTMVQAILTAQPGAPFAVDVSRCGQGQVSMTAQMGVPAGSELRLYDSDQGTFPVAVATNPPYIFTTGILATTTTYYVASYNNNTGCEGSRTPVVARIIPRPGLPRAMNATICGASGAANFMATMGSPEGTEIRLYSSLTSNFPQATAAAPPYVLTTPIVSTNTIFYIESVNLISGCVSDRAAVTAVINTAIAPGVPTVTDVSRCGTGQVTITALMGTPLGGELRLYNDALSDAVISSDGLAPYELRTPLISTTTTYYVASVFANTGCGSNRIPVVVTVNEIPSLPRAANVTRCEAGVVTFSGEMGAIPGTELRLYQRQSGGPALSIDNAVPFELTTPIIGATTNFYLESAQTATGCVSGRVAVSAIVTAAPAPPMSQNTSRCGTGSIGMTPMVSGAVSEIRVYTVPVGGSVVASASFAPFELVSPSLTATTTLYLESASTTTGCVSASRTPVVVTVHPVPGLVFAEDVRRCGTGVITFSVAITGGGGNQLRLYDGSGNVVATRSGLPTELMTPQLSGSANFTISNFNTITGCEGPRLPVVATVHEVPGVPIAENQSRCGSGPVTFTATMGRPEGNAIRLYNVSSGGSALQTSNNFPYVLTVNSLTASGNFFIESVNTQTGCASVRSTISMRVLTVPPAPAVSGQRLCGPGSVTFTANLPGGELRLYDGGGNVVSVGLVAPYNVVTPVLSATTTYYVASALGGCESSRVPAVATIDPLPGVPVVSEASRCGSGVLTLTILMGVPSGNEIRLYANEQGVDAVSVDNTAPFELSTGIVAGTTTFYAEASNTETGCRSRRVSVRAVVNATPMMPLAGDAQRCGPGSAVFTAQLNGGGIARLYSDATGGVLLSSASAQPYRLTTPFINTGTLFYIAAFDPRNGCESGRLQVQASVNSLPLPASVSDVSRCGAGVVIFTALPVSEENVEVRLFTTSTGGSPTMVDNVAPFTLSTAALTGSGTYYFEVMHTQTGCSSGRSMAMAVINGIPSAPLVNGQTRCGSGQVTFNVQSGSVAGTEFRLYPLSAGGDPLAVDATFPFELVTPVVAVSNTYYVESFNATTGCTSARASAPVTILTTPSAPVVSNVSRCGSGEVSFRPVVGQGTGARLYLSETGGLPIQSVSSAPVVLTVSQLTTTTTYYVSSFNGSCESGRVAVVATVGVLPTQPGVSNVSRCGAGPVVISANFGAVAGSELRLYNSSTGGSTVAVAGSSQLSFNLSFVSRTTTYFAAGVSGICESSRVPVVVTINDEVSVPRSTNVSRCGSGVVNFSAVSSSASTAEMRLYNTPTGGFALATSVSNPAILTTDLLTTTTSYYIAGGNDHCESGRVLVVATILPMPTLALAEGVDRCGSGSVTINATSVRATELRLYDSPQGGNLIANVGSNTGRFSLANVSTTTTYYVSAFQGICEGSRVPVVVNVGILPSAPVASSVVSCRPGTITFTAQMGNVAGTEMRLYNSNGGLVATAPFSPYTLTVTDVTSDSRFTVSAVSGNCESARTSVNFTLQGAPARPIAGSVVRCGSGQATLTASLSGPISNATVRWYDASGTMFATDNTSPYTTVVNVSQTTTYRVSVGQGVCESELVEQVVEVRAIPTLPSAANIVRCGAGVVTITGQMGLVSGNSLQLWDSPEGGNLVNEVVGEPYLMTLPIVGQTTTLYLSSSAGACNSGRRAVLITINGELLSPQVSGNSRCSAGSFSLTVTAPGASAVSLYTQSTGGVPVVTSTQSPFVLVTPSITTSTIWYVSSSNGSCESARVAVSVTINSSVRVLADVIPESCLQGGSIDVAAFGGSGKYRYVLGNQENTTGRFTNVPAGSYVATAIDELSGCTGSTSLEVLPLNPPSSVTVSEIGITQSRVSWSAIDGAVSYELRYRVSGGSYITLSNIPGSNTSVVLGGLTGGQDYEVQVRAFCSGGRATAYSGFQRFTTPTLSGGNDVNGTCVAPVNVAVAILSSTRATVNWTANLGGAVCYVVSYGPLTQSPDSWDQQLLIPHPQSSLELSGLQPGVNYGVRLRTNCTTCNLRSGTLTPYSSVVQFRMSGVRLTEEPGGSDFMDVSVYPNPGRGRLTVKFNTDGVAAGHVNGDYAITLIDLSGRELYHQGINLHEQTAFELDATHLSAGVYYLEIKRAGVTLPLVRQKLMIID